HLRRVAATAQRVDQLHDRLVALAEDDVIAELETRLGEIAGMRAADDDRQAEPVANLEREPPRLVRAGAQGRETNEVRLGDAAPVGRLDVLHADAYVVAGFRQRGADERHAVVWHGQAGTEARVLPAQLNAGDFLDRLR